MKKRWNQIIALFLGVCMLTSLCGCVDKQGSVSGECLELVDSPATTLDNVWYNPGGIFRLAVFESLLICDSDMKTIRCALAKEYSVSEDELTYTFVLRNDVKWHDGEKFSAEDVLFSFQAALRSEEINGLLSSTFQCIEGAEAYADGESEEISGITIEGNTIQIHLNVRTANFLSAMAQFAVLPKHLLGDVEPKELPTHDYWKKPVGCGAYRIKEAVEGEYFLLEVNPDYHGEKPGINQIRLRLNEENCVQAMQEGRLDFYITNDPEEISVLKGLEACSENRLNILFPAYLLVNMSEDEGTNPYLKDARVRKALLLSIDRKAVVDAIFPGSSVTDTLVPSWDEWYWEEAEAFSFHPEYARQLLEEAGYDFSKPLRLRYSTKGQSSKDLMNAIAVYWRAIGLQVSVEKFDGSGSEHMFNIRDYDVCYKRLSAFDYESIYTEVQGDGVMQTKVFHMPVYDMLLDELKVTMDREKQKDIICKMQSLDQEYLLRIPLFTLANVAYVNEAHFSMPEVYGNLWYRYDLCFEDWKLVDE